MDPTGRWLQLFAGVVRMVMIANLQYGWGRPAIQVAFSIFVLCEAWLVPLASWFVDQFGPRRVVMIGGVLIGLAWVVNAVAASLPMLYLGAALPIYRD
jgi:OFA family oxalate/formate antiporter-like MFS transporter